MGRKRVGGARAWCWVFELLDRGTPHTHFCLWTNNTIEQMIDDNIITFSVSQEKAEDRALVAKHQTHKHTAYCKSEYKECRFNYRRPLSSRTYLSEEGRYVLQREPGDECINGYNMELLRFGRVNMDLQYVLALSRSIKTPTLSPHPFAHPMHAIMSLVLFCVSKKACASLFTLFYQMNEWKEKMIKREYWVHEELYYCYALVL